MKKLKLLPMALMLVLCVGVLAIGIYAIQPTQNTITGTITVNGTNAPVVITVYEGTDTTETGTKLAEKEVRAGDEIPLADALVFDTEGNEENPVNKVEDVAPVQLTIVLSTTSNDMLVVNTPTIQTLGTDTDKEIVSLTKKHEKNNGLTGDELDYVRDETTGLACFTSGKDYKITLTFRLAKFLDAQTSFTYTIPLDIWEAPAFVASPDYDGGIDGVDYLYFGEYPQSKYTGSTDNLEDTGEIFASTKTTLGNNIYQDANGNRYVYINNAYTMDFVVGSYQSGISAYYKIEPLKWNILSQEGYGEQNTSGTLLVCDIAVEHVYYQNEFYYDSAKEYDTEAGCYVKGENGKPLQVDGKYIYSNNYEYSDLRAYLNDKFYNNAFNNIYKQLIKLTTVDNGVASTGYETNPYVCEDTEDYIFSLSEADLLNTDYGYASTTDLTFARSKFASEYALGMGGCGYDLSCSEQLASDEGYETITEYLLGGLGLTDAEATEYVKMLEKGLSVSYWWSRSPYYYRSSETRHVGAAGDINYYEVKDVLPNCVPALLLSL